jgi:hypothetical protein
MINVGFIGKKAKQDPKVDNQITPIFRTILVKLYFVFGIFGYSKVEIHS